MKNINSDYTGKTIVYFKKSSLHKYMCAISHKQNKTFKRLAMIFKKMIKIKSAF